MVHNQEALRGYPLLPQSELLVFLETDSGHTPASGYEEYCRRRNVARLPSPALYISTTITSGGFRRDEGMPIGEAIGANSLFARSLTQEGLLEYGLDPSWVILPSELGKVPGWKQTDYLQFWMYIIRAVHPDSAHSLEGGYFNNPSSEFPTIGDTMEVAPTYAERREAYIAFVRLYLQMKSDAETRDLLAPYWQAPVVLPGFDNGMSLGCSAEYYFAETRLHRWGFMYNSEEMGRACAGMLGRGAMVAGVTQTDRDRYDAENTQLLSQYYAGKDK